MTRLATKQYGAHVASILNLAKSLLFFPCVRFIERSYFFRLNYQTKLSQCSKVLRTKESTETTNQLHMFATSIRVT